MAAFILEWQNQVVETEIMWPANLKYLLFGPLQKKLADY